MKKAQAAPQWARLHQPAARPSAKAQADSIGRAGALVERRPGSLRNHAAPLARPAVELARLAAAEPTPARTVAAGRRAAPAADAAPPVRGRRLLPHPAPGRRHLRACRSVRVSRPVARISKASAAAQSRLPAAYRASLWFVRPAGQGSRSSLHQV